MRFLCAFLRSPLYKWQLQIYIQRARVPAREQPKIPGQVFSSLNRSYIAAVRLSRESENLFAVRRIFAL